MTLFSNTSAPCCSSASGTVLLVIHPATTDDFDFCYDIPEGDFPAVATELEELVGKFDYRNGVWEAGRFALRTVRFCDGCGKNEEIVSFDIPPQKATAVQEDVLTLLDGKGLVRRGEVWSVE